MNIEKYSEMDNLTLYKDLFIKITIDPIGSEILVKSLLESKKYMEDPIFRLVLDSGNALLLYIKGENTELISICEDLSNRAKEYAVWEVYIAVQSLMGGLYQRMDMLEKSLEHYRTVIIKEQEMNVIDYSAKAYGNIALLYESLHDYERALKYVEMAIELSEKAGDHQLSHKSKLLTFKSDYAIILCNVGRVEEALSIIRGLKVYEKEEVNVEARYSYNIAVLHYSFHHGDYEKAKERFRETRSFVSNINQTYEDELIEIFIRLCEEFSRPYSFYLDEIMEAYQNIHRYVLEEKITIYSCLRGYYREINNLSRFDLINEKFITALTASKRETMMRRVASLSLVDDLIHERQILTQVESKNTELQKILEEYNRHKRALQEVYQRIELVNELGRRVTSSLNLSTVIEMTYNNLCDTISIDSFMIAVAEPEQNRLRSVAYYDEKELKPSFITDLDATDSIYVECYKTKRTILSEDIHEDKRFKDKILEDRFKEVKSLVIIPLRIGEQLVGVFSVQSKSVGTYNYDHILLLEGLVPYMSIALNNAIYSQKLEHEIKAHLETQSELRKANDKLEALSSLDGLTRISNRRDFEKKILNLIAKAEFLSENVTVIMVDIDNFKLYNDTYGHLEGDEALKIVAKVIRENLDSVEGLSARFGGEEFVCACSGLSYDESVALGEKLCKDVFACNVEHKAVPRGIMSISVGVAFTKKSSVAMKSELMKKADESLYEAKNTGKNKCIIREIL